MRFDVCWYVVDVVVVGMFGVGGEVGLGFVVGVSD